jgi:medium-chain acyl-[acyl-carrier-protein] hydrolase
MTDGGQHSRSPWFITHSDGAGDAHLRLFCFHYAGGTASIFRSWRRMLPKAVELIAIQLPGREYRLAEPLLTDIAQIISALAEVIPPLLDRPYVFFGHSMGAIVSFDLVRALRARGLREPQLLIASGRNAPQFKWRDTGIQLLPDDDFIAAVRDYDGLPAALLAEQSLRDLWLPRLRADLTASAMYEYVEQRPLDCPIMVLSGEKDGLVHDVGLRGWLAHSTAGVRFFQYPGNHFFLHGAEQTVLGKLHAELNAQLARADGHNESEGVR